MTVSLNIKNDYAHKEPAAKVSSITFLLPLKKISQLKKFPPDKNFPNDLFSVERDGTHKQKDHNHR